MHSRGTLLEVSMLVRRHPSRVSKAYNVFGGMLFEQIQKKNAAQNLLKHKTFPFPPSTHVSSQFCVVHFSFLGVLFKHLPELLPSFSPLSMGLSLREF